MSRPARGFHPASAFAPGSPVLTMLLLLPALMLQNIPVHAQRLSMGMSMRADGFFNTPADCGQAFQAPFAPIERRPFGGLFTSSTYVTFAPFTTSSTSTECVDDALTQTEEARLHFVAANREALAAQVARGGGVELTVLGGLLGCPADALPALGLLLQPHYAGVFSSSQQDPAVTMAGIRAALSGAPRRTAACTAVAG